MDAAFSGSFFRWLFLPVVRDGGLVLQLALFFFFLLFVLGSLFRPLFK